MLSVRLRLRLALHRLISFAPKGTERIGARRAPRRRQDSEDTNKHKHR
jgi:hypothetical protein